MFNAHVVDICRHEAISTRVVNTKASKSDVGGPCVDFALEVLGLDDRKTTVCSIPLTLAAKSFWLMYGPSVHCSSGTGGKKYRVCVAFVDEILGRRVKLA